MTEPRLLDLDRSAFDAHFGKVPDRERHRLADHPPMPPRRSGWRDGAKHFLYRVTRRLRRLSKGAGP